MTRSAKVEDDEHGDYESPARVMLAVLIVVLGMWFIFGGI